MYNKFNNHFINLLIKLKLKKIPKLKKCSLINIGMHQIPLYIPKILEIIISIPYSHYNIDIIYFNNFTKSLFYTYKHLIYTLFLYINRIFLTLFN
jgi:hypothetical protein